MIKKRRKKSKNYFTQETEDYIVKYNNTKDSKKRSRIYETHIHYPFFKLTQNIIHTFKFYHTEVELHFFYLKCIYLTPVEGQKPILISGP
mgnify:CR=1 FL=1